MTASGPSSAVSGPPLSVSVYYYTLRRDDLLLSDWLRVRLLLPPAVAGLSTATRPAVSSTMPYPAAGPSPTKSLVADSSSTTTTSNGGSCGRQCTKQAFGCLCEQHCLQAQNCLCGQHCLCARYLHCQCLGGRDSVVAVF